jgi:hypothetical protein
MSDQSQQPDSKPTFSTPVILTLMITIYAWVAMVWSFFHSKNETLRYAAIGLAITSSILAQMIGRKEFAEAVRQRGQIRLSGLQSVLVAILVIGTGITLPWLAETMPSQKVPIKQPGTQVIPPSAPPGQPAEQN